jgi:hypothetical protein
VSLTNLTKGHKASSEEAFIITLKKFATGNKSTSFVEVLTPLLLDYSKNHPFT